MQNKLEELPFEEGKLFIVENYLEAVGMMPAVKSGVSAGAVRRPLGQTKVTQVQIRESSGLKRCPKKYFFGPFSLTFAQKYVKIPPYLPAGKRNPPAGGSLAETRTFWYQQIHAKNPYFGSKARF